MASASTRRLPAPVDRPKARFFGALLIGFSPLPLLLMLLSWGSDIMGGSLVPSEINVIGALYGLLGVASLGCGIALHLKFYRTRESRLEGTLAKPRPEPALGHAEIKRTSMDAPSEGLGTPEERLAAARAELSRLRVDYGLGRVERDWYEERKAGLEETIGELKEMLEPGREARLRRIPDHNRRRRR